jgi:LytS/YehU family sensor histidine kinase
MENVIKHNRMNRQFPLQIEFKIENDFLEVCNSYYPQQSNNSNGLGLKNLNKRCEILAGKSIIIEQNEEYFCVKVPLIKN